MKFLNFICHLIVEVKLQLCAAKAKIPTNAENKQNTERKYEFFVEVHPAKLIC